MPPGWLTTGIGVPALWTLAGALMFGPSDATHWAACATFAVAGLWLGVMGVIWFSTHNARDWTVWARAAGLAVVVLIATPMLIYFAWPVSAQNIPPGGVSGNCNNFGNNNFNCNTLNIAPPRAIFTSDLGRDLLAHMPDKNKKTVLTTVGNAADQKIGEDVSSFLQSNGFNVVHDRAGMMAPPPDHPFTFMDTPGAYVITVAPSAR
jgi:hypothetical protein